MKLFAIKDRTTNKLALDKKYFSNKVEAKEARNKLNPTRDKKTFIEGSMERYYIVKGPDHNKVS